MSAAVFWVRERWFEIGLRFFAAGALVALLTIALVALPQIRLLGFVALLQALIGVGVCTIGLRQARPARWNAQRRQARALFHRLRQRLRRGVAQPPSVQAA